MPDFSYGSIATNKRLSENNEDGMTSPYFSLSSSAIRKRLEALDSSPAAPVVPSATVASPPTELPQPVELIAPPLPEGFIQQGQYRKRFIVDPEITAAQDAVEAQRANEQAKIDLAAQAEASGYPSVFNPSPQTPVEAEEARILDVFAQPGPTQEKVDANLNPSVSGIAGVPGQYYDKHYGVGIRDERAAEMIAESNLHVSPNNAVSRGIGRLHMGMNLLGQQLGVKDTQSFIDRMQELNRIVPQAPAEVQEGLREIIDAEGVYDTIMATATNPGAILSVVGESLPQSVVAMLAAGITRSTAAGMAVYGLSSGANEFAAVINEEIANSGVDINDDAALTDLMANPEFISKARKRGALRGIPIGLFDALSFGIAGRLIAPAVASGRTLRTAAAIPGELAIQAGMGGLGETAAQGAEIVTGFEEDFELGDIVLETVAEIIPGGVEAIVQTAKQLPAARQQQIANELEAALKNENVNNDQKLAIQAAIEALNPNSQVVQPGEPKVTQINNESNFEGGGLIAKPDMNLDQLEATAGRDSLPITQRTDKGAEISSQNIDPLQVLNLFRSEFEGSPATAAPGAVIDANTAAGFQNNSKVRPSQNPILPQYDKSSFVMPDLPEGQKNPEIAVSEMPEGNTSFVPPQGVIDPEQAAAFGANVTKNTPSNVVQTPPVEIKKPNTPTSKSPENVKLPGVKIAAADTLENPQAPDVEPVGIDLDKPVVSVQSPDGQAKFNVKGKVVELAELKQAAGDLQPRDRSRKSSDVNVKDRAGSKFNAERLMDDPTSGSGAPIIARDGTIMSGNGRVLTMKEVYANQPESLARYREKLEEIGINTEGFSQPIYVRQLNDDMTMAELSKFAELANNPDKEQMSVTERSSNDAKKLTESNIIDTFNGDFDIDAAANRTFITEYAKKILSPTEQGVFFQSNGNISAEGINRVRGALLAAAFDNSTTISKMLEASDNNIKSIANAFVAVAPKFAQVKRQIANNQTDSQWDITPQLSEMANLISQLRTDDVKVADYFAQNDMFGAKDPQVEEYVRAFYKEDLSSAISGKAMREFLTFYANEALQKQSGGLIPDTTTPSDVINVAVTKQREEQNAKKGNNQGSLLEPSGAKQSNDAGRKQVQKPRNAPSRNKLEETKQEADVSTIPDGQVFNTKSQTLRQSNYRSAFAEAGFDPKKLENAPVARKFKILSDETNKKFGLKFIAPPEAGATNNQVNQLLDAYHNLTWMTHSLGMPSTAIGLEGTLGLTLPSKVGRYLGAYVHGGISSAQSDVAPMEGPFISMPERSNSFAHEWGHALDFHLMEKYGGNNAAGISGVIRANNKLGDRAWDATTPANVKEAFAGVINSMYFDNAEFAAKLMALEHKISAAAARQSKNGKPNKTLEADRLKLEKLLEGSTRAKILNTEFRKNSGEFGRTQKSFGENYFKKPTEMFARSFEAYIARSVEAIGGPNEFITKGDKSYQAAKDQLKGADDRLAMTFPKDQERHRIFLAMDQLMEAMRLEAFAAGQTANKPSDLDTMDAVAQFHGDLQIEERTKISSLPKKVVKDIAADQAKATRIAKNRAAEAAKRPSDFVGDTVWERKANQIQDTFFSNFVNTKRQILFNISKRHKDNKRVRAIMEDIISKVATDPGSLDKRVTFKNGTFEEASRINSRRFNAVFDRLRQKHKIDELNGDGLKNLRLILVGDTNATAAASEQVLEMASDIRRQLLNPIYDYMVKNNQNVNYITNAGYMPRMLDARLAISEQKKFVGELNGKKGAIPLYEQVIYENEYGSFDAGNTEQMSSLASLANSKSLDTVADLTFNDVTLEELQEISANIKDQLKEIKSLDDAIESNTGETDVEGLQETISEITESLNDQHEALHEGLRPFYATAAGKDFHNRIVLRNGSDPSVNGVQGSFAKKRSLPAEADVFLADFYLNPIEAIMEYIPATARYTEYNARFGSHLIPKGKGSNDGRDFLDYSLEEALLGGMKPHEAREVATVVKMITGRYGGQDDLLSKSFNTLNTYGTMALLPRAVLSSVAEPITAAIQTGDVKDGFKNFAYSFDGLLATKNARERKQYFSQLANVLGVIDLPQSGDIIANRVGGVSEEDAKNTKRLGLFFQRTFLTGITNAQRRASMRIGLQYIIGLSKQYQENKQSNDPSQNKMKTEAESSLMDFGISPENMSKFTEYASNLNRDEKGFYDISKIMEASGDLTDTGRMFAVAVGRFVDQTIQDPKIVDRPKWAETPVGRSVFGIQSFIAAFQRNVLEMSAKRAVRDFKQAGAAAGTARLGKKMVLPLASLYIAHTLVSATREAVFNPERWEEEREKGTLIKYLMTLGISRSGMTGRLDPIVNGFVSLKYRADLSNVVVGATASMYLHAIQRIAGLAADSNSKNTPTAEYQAARGIYDIIVPALMGLATVNPYAGAVVGGTLGLSNMVITSPRFKKMVLKELVETGTGQEYKSGGGRSKKSSGGFGGGGFGD